MKKKLILKVVAVLMALTFLPILPQNNVANAASSGSFTVLSYNVGGLPDIISSSNPKEYTIQISPLLNNFDFVSVQEDFAYHNDLIRYDNHPYRTATSGNVPFGDGMNFMSNWELKNRNRVTWNDRHGYFDNGSDMLTPKGILFSRIEIADGYYIDIYNIHADAGSSAGDYAARRSNMNQLAAMIETVSEGNAVIVAGDTNCRFTRAEDNFETAVLDRYGLTDCWVQMKRGGVRPADGNALIDHNNLNSANNEAVDKIQYRSGAGVTLNCIDYNLLTNFVDPNGNQLSDHYPITATFSWSTNDNIKATDQVGGNSGGVGFSFYSTMGTRNLPTSITIRGANRIDAVSFNYNGITESAGGTGGTAYTLNLNGGEYITSMTCNVNKYNGTDRIFYLKFTTSSGRTISAGVQSGTQYTFLAPSGYAIGGLFGRAGTNVDAIGAYFIKR